MSIPSTENHDYIQRVFDLRGYVTKSRLEIMTELVVPSSFNTKIRIWYF